MRASTMQIRGGLCEHCFINGTIQAAEEVDHVIPHRNDAKLFFDPDNLQLLCTVCHAKKTASETRAESTSGWTKNSSTTPNKNLKFLCCPPYFDYRKHAETPDFLDEYVIAHDIYKSQGEQELMVARKLKMQKAMVSERASTYISYNNSLTKRYNELDALGIDKALLVIPELYLVHEEKSKEAERWLTKLQTGNRDIIKRCS